jgi:hypothetical protein
MATITFDTVRKIAATLPGVEESTNSRGTGLTVGGKLLACPAVHKSAEPNSMVLRIDRDQREALIADAPDTFYVTDHYVNYPSVLVRLSSATPELLRDALRAACKFVSASGPRKRPQASRKPYRGKAKT